MPAFWRGLESNPQQYRETLRGLAMPPFLHMTRKDLWQLYVLGDSS